MHYGVCQLGEGKSVLLLLRNVNKTVRIYLILQLHEPKCMEMVQRSG